MADTCPKCGAEYRGLGMNPTRIGSIYECGATDAYGELRETECCLRRQLAQAQAERDALKLALDEALGRERKLRELAQKLLDYNDGWIGSDPQLHKIRRAFALALTPTAPPDSLPAADRAALDAAVADIDLSTLPLASALPHGNAGLARHLSGPPVDSAAADTMNFDYGDDDDFGDV